MPGMLDKVFRHKGEEMKSLMLIVLLVFLSGCGILDSQTGTKTTVNYDASGKVESAITEEVAVGDKYTEYSGAVKSVVKSKKETVTAQVLGIQTVLAPLPTDNETVAALKGVIASQAIASINFTDITSTVTAIHYGKDGHDNIDTALGVVKTGVIGTAVGYSVDKVTGALVEAVGNKINITGDGNSVETSETTTETEAHATTVGENSPAATNLDQSKTETHGDEPEEEGDDNETPEPEMPANCEGNGEYNTEKERWYLTGSDCSCESFEAGDCTG